VSSPIQKGPLVILNTVKNLEMTGRRYTCTAFILHIQDSSLSLRMTKNNLLNSYVGATQALPTD
jgi:hypothetical protein